MLVKSRPLFSYVNSNSKNFSKFMSVRFYTNECILTEINQCGVITLNRPKALNALNSDMIRSMYPKLKKWNDDDKITHVIIEGAGDKAFCAGGDVVSIAKSIETDNPLSKEFFYEEYLVNYLIGTFKKPYIALLDGITMGGGVGVSVHGKYRVATGKSMLAMPETAIGLFPDVGGGYFLPRLKPKGLGLFLALTGHRLIGSDLLWAGIATHFTPSERIELLKENLCSIKSESQEAANNNVLEVLNDFHTSAGHVDPPIADRLDFISKHFAIGENPLDYCAVEKILHSLEELERKGDEWAKKLAQVMRRQSPTSMKMAYTQLAYGASMSLGEVLQMEYRLTQHCMAGSDFREGVRALLIDKDNSPKWHPHSLQEITARQLTTYFSSDANSSVKKWKPV